MVFIGTALALITTVALLSGMFMLCKWVFDTYGGYAAAGTAFFIVTLVLSLTEMLKEK